MTQCGRAWGTPASYNPAAPKDLYREDPMRLKTVVLVAALFVSGAAYAAQAYSQNPGQQRRDDRDRPAYDDGYRNGREDAMRGRSMNTNGGGRWHTGHERHAYQDGYTAGYQSVGPNDRNRDRDRDRDRDDRNRGGYRGTAGAS